MQKSSCIISVQLIEFSQTKLTSVISTQINNYQLPRGCPQAPSQPLPQPTLPGSEASFKNSKKMFLVLHCQSPDSESKRMQQMESKAVALCVFGCFSVSNTVPHKTPLPSPNPQIRASGYRSQMQESNRMVVDRVL